MNSILQGLSHLQKFHQCFLYLDPSQTQQLPPKARNGEAGLRAGRWPRRAGERRGLCSDGGASISRSLELTRDKEPSSKHCTPSPSHVARGAGPGVTLGRASLGAEPQARLPRLPQQDAQDFLGELLRKVQPELKSEGTTRRTRIPFSRRKLTKQVLKAVSTTVHGQLLSQATCISCNYKSNTIEPFWDLSLEFPDRYHRAEKGSVPLNQTECLLTEKLAKFTETGSGRENLRLGPA